MKIAASFLGAKNIPKLLTSLNVTNIDYIHVDVMDGKYVKNKTMPFSELCNITFYTRKRLDIHLMVSKPLKWIDEYASLNAEFLTFHLDIKDDLDKVFEKCHQYGVKIGLAVNPDDSVEKIYPYLDRINLVLIMSVVPGRSGQKFIETTYEKLDKLRDEIKKRHLKTLISVDGGVDLENAKKLKKADILVSGSTIMNSSNYQEMINKLRD